ALPGRRAPPRLRAPRRGPRPSCWRRAASPGGAASRRAGRWARTAPRRRRSAEAWSSGLSCVGRGGVGGTRRGAQHDLAVEALRGGHGAAEPEQVLGGGVAGGEDRAEVVDLGVLGDRRP